MRGCSVSFCCFHALASKDYPRSNIPNEALTSRSSADRSRFEIPVSDVFTESMPNQAESYPNVQTLIFGTSFGSIWGSINQLCSRVRTPSVKTFFVHVFLGCAPIPCMAMMLFKDQRALEERTLGLIHFIRCFSSTCSGVYMIRSPRSVSAIFD